MLFSSDTVAKAIQTQFEPVWVSVRDVPVVTIDFGKGRTITRTLNGNVATYALAADGTVLDILPGIYQPEEYTKQLNQMALLNRYVHDDMTGALLEKRLIEYHAKQAEQIKAGKEPGVIVMNSMAAVSKVRIENPLKLVISGKDATIPVKHTDRSIQSRDPSAAATLRSWQELTDDTVINETMHRKVIHERLAELKRAKTVDITKWLYKTVLHADLDDPYLGLGEVLNKNYPFAVEDSVPVPAP